VGKKRKRSPVASIQSKAAAEEPAPIEENEFEFDVNESATPIISTAILGNKSHTLSRLGSGGWQPSRKKAKWIPGM